MHATVGRSVACDVVLDDPHVAAVHVRLSADAEGRVTATDLDSLNGIDVGGRRVRGGAPVALPDGALRVGRTRLRVRTAAEVLAPEQVDAPGASWLTPVAERKALAVAFALGIVVSVLEVWTTTEQPRELATGLVTALLAILVVAALWIAVWALASRVAFGESRWVRHALIIFAAYAALSLVLTAVELANGALGLHLPLAELTIVLLGLTASVALAAHLVNASPTRSRVVGAIGVAIPAVVLVAFLWMQARGEARSPSHVPERDSIVPPALLLRPGLALDRFLAEAGELPARADAKRVFVEREDPSPAEDE